MPYFSIWNFIELVTTVMLALHVCTASSTPGVVSLDDWTFDKVVDGSRHVLVKFDKKYPYGPLEMSYQAFVNDIRDTVLLTAEVGVQDFGDDQNNALKQRFKLDTETLPVYKLFVPHGGVKTFPGPVTADALRRWVAMQVDDIWIGLRGCLQVGRESFGRSGVDRFSIAALDRKHCFHCFCFYTSAARIKWV
eukprot:m.323871 g.323871  ORF g.323871 m.323871 type:complete len:192 (-) comp20363_c0_seq1:111-686(-)